MKNFIKRFSILSVLSLSAGVAHATCANSGDQCQPPRNGAITAHSATTISEQVQNATTPNVANSVYFFQATTLGAPQNNGTLDRNTVVVFTEDFGSGLSGDLIAQTVKPLLNNSTYHGYAMACPPGTGSPTPSANGCSAWVSIGSQVTDALTNVGFNNIAAADTQPLQFTARTNGSLVDQTDVIAWLATQLASTEVGNCALSNNLQPFPSSGLQSLTITSADCNTLLPNRPYTLTEHLVYDPTQSAPSFTSGVFYTQAKDPVALTISPATITHCSATIPFQNAAANPANPSDTNYSVNIGGPVSSGSATQGQVINGTGIFSDQNSVTYTNLQAGTPYAPTVTALNRGGGGWLSSAAVPYTGFNTVPWGGTFSISNIGTTTADFVASGVNTAGVQTWQIQTTPAVAGLPSGTAADLNGTHTITGLSANVPYTIQIKISEASGCFSVLPITALTLTTTPTIPQSFALVANSPRQLGASWLTNGNAAGTIYQVQYCTDAGFTLNCLTQNSAAGATSLTINSVNPETQYFAHVKALTVGGGLDSAFSNSSNATTPNEGPVLTVDAPQVWVTSATLTVHATDNGGPSNLVFQWAPATQTGASLTSTTGITTIVGQTAFNSTQITFAVNGNYSGTITVFDHGNSGPNVLSTQGPWSTNPLNPVPTKILITPSPATVVTGFSQLFTAIVCDQFETGVCNAQSTHIMPNQSVNWSINGGGTPLTSAGATYNFAATTPSGGTPWVLTATTNGINQTDQVTVTAAGPQFNSMSFVIDPTHKSGIATAVGHDNVAHAVNHNWSANDPSVSFNPVTGQTADGVPMNSTVIFTKAGTFTLTDSLGSGVSSSTIVVVPQDLTSIKVCAMGDANCSSEITLQTLQNAQFTATGMDQFGNTMPVGSVQWSSDGGKVSPSGATANFSGQSVGQTVHVTATSGGKSGSVLVNLVSFDVSGAFAYPVPYKASMGNGGVIHFTGLGSQSTIRIYTASGHKVFETQVNGTTYPWTIKNSSGENVASGVYFYVIESTQGKKDGKLIIIQ